MNKNNTDSSISPIFLAKSIVNQRKANSLPVYDFTIGECPFSPPLHLINTLKENADKCRYSSPEGIPELNKAIKKAVSTNIYNVDTVIVGNGLKELSFLLQSAFDGVLLFITPVWISYIKQAEILKKPYKLIRASIHNNYKITTSDLMIALQEINISHPGKSVMLFLNTPTNPTGAVYTTSELYEISKICQLFQTIIFVDEIYGELVFNGKQESIKQFYPENTITGSSLSKAYCAGGWRLGWITFPKTLYDLSKKANSIASNMYSCVSHPLQYVAVEALTYHPKIYENIRLIRDYFKILTSYVYNFLKDECSLQTSYPEAAWYIYIDFANYASKLRKAKIYNSTDLMIRLAENTGIVGATGFMGDEEYSLRFSLIQINTKKIKDSFDIWAKDIIDALYLLKKWLSNL